MDVVAKNRITMAVADKMDAHSVVKKSVDFDSLIMWLTVRSR